GWLDNETVKQFVCKVSYTTLYTCDIIAVMNTQLHYTRSPLTEAVIDIRVTLREGFPFDALTALQSEIQTDYPSIRDFLFFEAQFSTDPDQPAASGNRSRFGYTLVSSDERQIAQAHLNGFSLSRLQPYENWGSFRDEARRLWAIYKSIAQPD